MPAVSEDHRAAQRDRVHRATLGVLRAKGMSRTAMSDIIAASGMSAGAIYRYFPSKDALIASLVEWLISGRLDALRQAAAAHPVPSPDEAFAALFASLPEHLVSDGIVLQIWGEAASNAQIRVLAQRVLAELYDGTAAYLRAWFAANGGMDPGEAARRAEVVAPGLVAMAQGYLVQAALADTLDQQQFTTSVRAISAALSR